MAILILAGAHRASSLDFPPSDFDILNADNGQLIGHGHYTLEQTSGGMTLRGENHYLNGDYDVEEDKLAGGDATLTPPLVSFRHDFFDAAGRRRWNAGRLDTADRPRQSAASSRLGVGTLGPQSRAET